MEAKIKKKLNAIEEKIWQADQENKTANRRRTLEKIIHEQAKILILAVHKEIISKIDLMSYSGGYPDAVERTLEILREKERDERIEIQNKKKEEKAEARRVNRATGSHEEKSKAIF
jgi:hypothetical protein